MDDTRFVPLVIQLLESSLCWQGSMRPTIYTVPVEGRMVFGLRGNDEVDEVSRPTLLIDVNQELLQTLSPSHTLYPAPTLKTQGTHDARN